MRPRGPAAQPPQAQAPANLPTSHSPDLAGSEPKVDPSLRFLVLEKHRKCRGTAALPLDATWDLAPCGVNLQCCSHPKTMLKVVCQLDRQNKHTPQRQIVSFFSVSLCHRVCRVLCCLFNAAALSGHVCFDTSRAGRLQRASGM